MARVPPDFEEEFEAKGETFFEIAELLYTTPDRKYTQGELADAFDCSKQTISNHTETMSEWLDRLDGQTTYAWNTDAHNPAATEDISATKSFYRDLWRLFKKHTETVPGTFALMGFGMLVTAVVMIAFFIGFSLSITADSAIPTVFYLAIAVGSFLTGIIVTLLSPFQAIVNRFLLPRLPDSLFQNRN